MPKYFFFCISIGRSYLPSLILSSILLTVACKQSEAEFTPLHGDLANTNSCFEENLVDSDPDKFYVKSDYHFPPNSLRNLPILKGQNPGAIMVGIQSGNYAPKFYHTEDCELFECY